ncbi:hypothetical protein M514_11317 [Trichuris suis]|uniref:Uncharacterized protein n=1 Tax=Trichuris suis TaxID=68888 RepID=A0A085MXP9_9BILA|nr:hypothetical protein M513_11317 [Trichuris suis]KFD61995.1 hypothetical protein M514_11317 [Trichuris suis]
MRRYPSSPAGLQDHGHGNRLFPAEVTFGRSLRTNVPVIKKNLLPQHVRHAVFRQRKQAEKERQTAAFKRRHGARIRPSFAQGDKVLIRVRNESGIVTNKQVAARSYEIETTEGAMLRRNTFFLLPDSSTGTETGNKILTECQTRKLSSTAPRTQRCPRPRRATQITVSPERGM